MSPAKVEQKVGWARAAAAAAGRDPDALDYQLRIFDLRVRHNGAESGSTSSLAQLASPEELADSPSVLHGSPAECAEKLLAIREKYGINYIHLGSNVDAAAPIVARLAGA
jgi:alkanesulfonate monooxygenase SsuD/methylene tetrahydromethanopterin reductase-like flavin-dependent oxidoreductase (luciferase family)